MSRRIVTAVVTVFALAALTVGLLAVFGSAGPAGATGPKVAPEPYQAAHAWAWRERGRLRFRPATDFSSPTPTEAATAAL